MSRKKVSVSQSSMIGHDLVASDINIKSTLQTSPLCRLPLEIRWNIYSLIFGEPVLDVHVPVQQSNTDCEICSGSYITRGLSSKARRKPLNVSQELQTFRNKRSPLAVAATCKQFHDEAIKVWYGNTRFILHSIPCTILFLKEIGDSNRDTIRYVTCDHARFERHKSCKEILHLVSTFARVKSLTFENVGSLMSFETVKPLVKPEELEKLLEMWKRNVYKALGHWERLESLVFTSKSFRVELTNQSL